MKLDKYPCGQAEEEAAIEALPQAQFTLLSENCDTYTVIKGQHIFTDMSPKITTCAPELKGLTGIRFSLGEAIAGGITVKLELAQDSQLLLAYMDAKAVEWLQMTEEG